MDTLLEMLREYGTWTYLILFAYCALKSGALPLFGGYAAHAGALEIEWVLFVVFSGGYLGDELRFHLARYYNIDSFERWPRIQSKLETARKLMMRYGSLYIFLYRYPKGMRTIGALPVGLTNIAWVKFTFLNSSSAILWTILLVGGGYVFGNTIEQAVTDNWGFGSVLLLFFFLVVSYFAWRKIEKVGQINQ